MGKNIVLIQFSSRGNGNCSAITAEIAKFYSATRTIHSYIVNSNVVQACNDCNYECLQPDKQCPNLNSAQKEIMDNISNADLAYYIIPNYCGYPCANYFAFNERSVGYFNMDRASMQKFMSVPKRFIIISNTEGPNFENALKQQYSGDLDILYLKTGKYKKRSTAGDMMESLEAAADLKAFLETYPI